MAGAHGGSFKRDDAAALEDPVEDGFGEVGVVQDAPPELERLVGGEDHGAPAAVALVDDMEENVGGVGSVGEVADFGVSTKFRTIWAVAAIAVEWAWLVCSTYVPALASLPACLRLRRR